MRQSITVSQFDDAFVNMGRQDQFSYEGRHALYEYIEQMDEECGTDTELDVIALCCEFTEYADLEAFQSDYGDECQSIDDISNRTTVIDSAGESFLIQQF